MYAKSYLNHSKNICANNHIDAIWVQPLKNAYTCFGDLNIYYYVTLVRIKIFLAFAYNFKNQLINRDCFICHWIKPAANIIFIEKESLNLSTTILVWNILSTTVIDSIFVAFLYVVITTFLLRLSSFKYITCPSYTKKIANCNYIL